MTLCFPEAYPDEILYSLCARYQDRVHYPAQTALLHELFGTKRVVSTIELPTHLDALIARLPVEHGYTVDTVIDHHTLMPLYAPFLAPERLQLVRTQMQGEQTQGIARIAGVVGGAVAAQDRLRFCPTCVAEDRCQFGEAYWHRVHQAPGVEVCPRHAVFVSASALVVRGTRASQHYYSVEALLTGTPVPMGDPIEPTDPTHRLLFALAQDIAWLLNHPHTALEGTTVHARYLHLLHAQGFATRTGRLDLEALRSAFAAWYPADIQVRLPVPLQLTGEPPWPVTLARKPRGVQHPLRHLLMIQFLRHTVETFFQLPADDAPFGHGPWPCLNPACDRYHQDSISACQISYHGGKTQEPVGKFACACGFVYARRGPDDDLADRFRHTDVIAVGPVWETQLTEFWLDATYTLRDIARQLKTDSGTVRRRAQRLGLPFPRPGHPALPATLSKPPHDRVKRDTVTALLPAKRAEWLALIQSYPDGGVKLAKGAHRRLYDWLGRHDRAWRTANTPRRAKYRDNLGDQRPNYQAVWTARDAEYAPQVCAAATRIRATIPPERVTVTSLSRDLFPSKEWFLSAHLAKLPSTAQIVAEETESREQFQIRRIAWVATVYQDEHHLPTRSQFEKRALVYKIRYELTIRAAVDAALRCLALRITEPGARAPDSD